MTPGPAGAASEAPTDAQPIDARPIGASPTDGRQGVARPEAARDAPPTPRERDLEALATDLTPALTPHEALVAADRCYFCHDAPCVAACPTAIDIPLFIRQIATGATLAAARTILAQNVLGGISARVCPTETLCEAACVREAAEGRPVEIGRLQRFATDAMMAEPRHPFERRPSSGRRVAVVGAGPAGLACAHRLAVLGHDVTVFDRRAKGGGLNEYGIAAYKVPDEFAARELEWLLGVGGVQLRLGLALGRDVTLSELREDYDAVFLGIGLGATGALGLPGEELPGVRDAVDFIAELRQAIDPGAIDPGRHVVVIGGGMTAIDAAVQSKLLGAETVTIAYRRGRAEMAASRDEQEHAAACGVAFRLNVRPRAVLGPGAVREIELEYTAAGPDGLRGTGETFRLPCDRVLRAIGQSLEPAPPGLALASGRLAVEGPGRTSVAGVWAGGDCVRGGEDLTVTAVAHGRDAAEDIHRWLTAA